MQTSNPPHSHKDVSAVANIERLPPKPIQYDGGVDWEGGSKGGGVSGRDVREGIEDGSEPCD